MCVLVVLVLVLFALTVALSLLYHIIGIISMINVV